MDRGLMGETPSLPQNCICSVKLVHVHIQFCLIWLSLLEGRNSQFFTGLLAVWAIWALEKKSWIYSDIGICATENLDMDLPGYRCAL